MARSTGRSRRGAPAGTAPDIAPDEYRRWTTTSLVAAGKEIAVVSKPGVPGHGGLDPATGLLLDHLEIEPGESLLCLHCGTGALGAFAAVHTPAGRVRLCDRNLLAVRAAQQTLRANAVDGVAVDFGVAPEEAPAGAFDVVTVRLPVGRLPTLHQLWTAALHLRPGGRCYLAGANDEGIRTALRTMEEIFGGTEVLGYRGGNRIAVAVRPEHLPASAAAHEIPWTDPERFHAFVAETPAGPLQIRSRPGVFSWDRLDAGSHALLETMRIGPGEEILELGCGYGVVGIAAAILSGEGRATLLDVDAEAIRSARRSAGANDVADRVEVLPGDAADAVGDRRFDVVITNPPFHLEKGTNLAIPAQFIRDAARVLRPGGRLYLVANRTLPYERWLEAAFGSYEIARDGREFKVLTATAGPHPERG